MQIQHWTLGLMLAVLLGLAVFAASAEIGVEDPCRSACQEAHDLCIQECSAHSNPVECGSSCDDARADCHLSCG
jgi:hypothetical protein